MLYRHLFEIGSSSSSQWNFLNELKLIGRDGNGLGRPPGSLTWPKNLGPMGHVGRPQTRFGSLEPALTNLLGQQG
jgi:hypothetical protein